MRGPRPEWVGEIKTHTVMNLYVVFKICIDQTRSDLFNAKHCDVYPHKHKLLFS